MGRVDRNDQIHSDALTFKDLGKSHRAKAAHGMSDQNDRRGTFAILVDRLFGNQAADGELVDVCRDARTFEPLGKTVYPAREKRTQRAAEQISPPAPFNCGLSIR